MWVNRFCLVKLLPVLEQELQSPPLQRALLGPPGAGAQPSPARASLASVSDKAPLMKWWFPWFLLNAPTPAALLLCRPPFPASVLQLRNPQPPDTRPWPGCPQAAQKGQVPSPAVPKPGSQSSCLRNHLLVYRSGRRGAIQSPPSSGPCSLPLIHSLLFTHPTSASSLPVPSPGP